MISKPMFYRSAEPYLTRMFGAWRVLSEWYDPENGEVGRVRLAARSCVLTVTSPHRSDPGSVSFAPDESYSESKQIDLDYLRWVLGHGQQRDSIDDLLLWFEMHPWWRFKWTQPEVFDRISELDEPNEALSSEVMQRYWWRDGPQLPWQLLPTVHIEPLADDNLEWLGSEDDLRNGYIRSSGFLAELLERSFAKRICSVGGVTALAASNDDWQIAVTVGGSMPSVFVAPCRIEETEWFDVSRTTRLFDREELGTTLESRLYFVLRHRKSLQSICSAANYEAFLFAFERAEKLQADLKHFLVFCS